MARLTVDYCKVRNDPRFRALARHLGSEGEAWDRLLRFWHIAQEAWGHGRRPIAEKIFGLEADLECLVDVGLAERTPEGVYAKGARDFFEWYAEKLESARHGGKASAAARREKYGSAIPIHAKNAPSTEAPTEHPTEAPPKHAPNEHRSTTEPSSPKSPNPSATALATALASSKHISPPNGGSSDRPTDPTPDDAPVRLKVEQTKLSPRDLAEAWNQARKGIMPAVSALSADSGRRWTHAKARIKEHDDLDFWRETFKRVAASSFLRGEGTPREGGGRPWVATFDWVINPTNLAKVLDGNYDEQKAAPDDGLTPALRAFLREGANQ